MKKLIIVAIILIAVAQTGTAAEKISIATNEWLPYCGKFLPNYGIEPQIISAALQREGWDAEFTFMAWARALKLVGNGKYDAVTSASFTQERAVDHLYSESYMGSPIVFYKRKDAPITWNTLKDLKPYKIGTVKANSYSPEFDKADFLHKVTSKNDVLCLKKLILKQADLVVMDRFVGHYIIEKKLIAHEKKEVEVLEPPLHMDKLHLMFSKKAPDVSEKLAAFNAGLKKIIKDGTLTRILEKYGFKK